MVRYLRTLIVCYGVLGFLLQALVGGSSAHHALCVGCAYDLRTIGSPCDPVDRVSCCDADPAVNADQQEAAHPQASLPQGKNDCGCIDVLLPHQPMAVLTAPSVERQTDSVGDAPSLLICCCFTCAERYSGTILARAGPRSPPRSLLPQYLCTVLVI